MKLGRKSKIALSSAGILGGLGLIKSSNKDGRITGTINLYHGTDDKNLKKIYKEGLKKSHARDKNTLLKEVYGKDYIKNDDNIYLSKDVDFSNDVNQIRFENNYLKKYPNKYKDKCPAELGDEFRRTQGILSLKFPKTDFNKLKKVDNPELLGAKNRFDFYKKYEKKNNNRDVSGFDKLKGGLLFSDEYKRLSKDTVTVNEDIPSKYIVGSKDYKLDKEKNFKDHIKNNPGEFIRGVGQTALGTSGVILGVRGLIKRKG